MPYIRLALLLVLEQTMCKTSKQILQDLLQVPHPDNPSRKFLTLRTLNSAHGSIRLALEGLVVQGLARRSEEPGQDLQFWLTDAGAKEKERQKELLKQQKPPIGATAATRELATKS